VRNLIQIGMAIVVVLSLPAPPALATEDWTMQANLSGKDLFENCNGEDADRLLCQAYVVGIADALLLEKSAGSSFAGWDACIPTGPTGVKSERLITVVNKMLVEHPELRHLPAATLVATALSEAFPCKE
jgi:Rap1a immunity proteins